jgi:hypothetical protein
MSSQLAMRGYISIFRSGEVEEEKNKKSRCFSVQIFLSSQEKKPNSFAALAASLSAARAAERIYIYSPQIANPKIATLAEGPKI